MERQLGVFYFHFPSYQLFRNIILIPAKLDPSLYSQCCIGTLLKYQSLAVHEHTYA